MRIITEAHAEALVTMPIATSPEHNVSEVEIEQAIRSGIERYFDDCRARVPAFIDRHFHYPGALATNRMALGWDMLRAPINLLWAPVYALVCLVKILVPKRTGLMWLHGLANRVPAGFTTRVQQHISHLILADLLNNGQKDSRLEGYLIEALEAAYERHSCKPIEHQRFSTLIEPLVADALSQYRMTRTASADITNSISCTVLGAFAFQKFTPGGIGLGVVLASMLAETLAAQDFILGGTLGSWYYSWFPPEPSLATTASVMIAVMGSLAAFAAFSGVIFDPVQAAVGLHRRRLHKLMDHLQRDVTISSQSSFRPKDQFVARILDMFDMIKSGLL
ncbi:MULTISPECIES: DUF6635 family protein [unclassified Marinobacter]|jgi:hypothetical protein|uniref:DUF6635 family protein n=1 Tax=unclassified Marinobacter TaxID=83889 RepID=UPI00200CCD79|nr:MULTISPECIES: DUF6635 family protein [unclassified Marinobacter]MCL1478749.1 hypothetical protein [Marinobacter sp.]MCL1481771.1 hypothetical protein [Marinobacter sp.]MCL1484508.1 hypothetical protein [Marinobacter sp.]UQG54922.1 hypothetical protein MIH16_16025 [Marinobacter sp. M4C]UQG63723.1 hypothetical protein MIH17_16010 [Marinobacter sp. M2C]